MQVHARVDRDVLRLRPDTPRDRSDRALEAGRETDREQLLGVGAAALAAQLGREAQVDLERAVGRLAMPFDPASGDMGRGRVQDLVAHAKDATDREKFPRAIERGVPSSAMTATDVFEFETSFKGEIVRPGHERYDELRSVFNAMIDRRPALIARCRTTADVQAGVNYARDSSSTARPTPGPPPPPPPPPPAASQGGVTPARETGLPTAV